MRTTWIAAAIVIALVLAAGIGVYWADEMASISSSSSNSTAGDRSTPSPSYASSSSVSSGSSGARTVVIRVITNQSSSTSNQQYPLAWAGASPGVCGDLGDMACCDFASFCISASLRFWNATSSDTTITEGNATTIVRDSTTTIYRSGTQTITCQEASNSTSANHTSSTSSTSCTSSVNYYPETDVISPSGSTSHPVDVTVIVQDAVTGQNITTLSDGCDIQTTLSPTECQVGTRDMPAGHTYKVTVLVTAQDHKTLLAPPRTITVSV